MLESFHDPIEALFANGHAADVVLAVLAVETIVLIVIRRRSGRGPAPVELIAAALPGAALVLALRAALTSASAIWIGAMLLVAFAFHLADLAARWRRAGRR